MRVKFLVDYEGRETAYKKVKAGDEIVLDQQPAIELIKFGIVEEVGVEKEVFTPRKRKAKEGDE
jgi:hypothetical protein